MSAADANAAPGAAVDIRGLLLAGRATLPPADARIDSELLLALALERPRAYLFAHPDAVVAPAVRERYLELLLRRRDGEPLAYLLGRQEFWTLDLALDGTTLVPRPETELLVELALQRVQQPAARVLDLGTGSGAIALALASERPAWRVMGVDIDPRAVRVATANAQRLGLAGVRFAVSDWFAAIAGESFDLVVANPPYIRDADPCLGEPGLRREPRLALASGPDGLAALRLIAAAAPARLAAGGWLMCEHGAEQGAAVRALLCAAGFAGVLTRRDLAGFERVTLGLKPAGSADER